MGAEAVFVVTIPAGCLADTSASAAVAGETVDSATAKPAAAAKRGIIRRVMFICYLTVLRSKAKLLSSLTIRQLEANADHGVASATTTSTTTTCNARTRQRLLPRGARFRLARLLLLPPGLVLFTIARCLLLAAGAGILFVTVLARGGRRSRRGGGLLVGDTDFAFQRLTRLAFDRTDACRALDEFGHELLRHHGLVGGLAFDLQKSAQRSLGRGQRTIGAADIATEPDQLHLGRANQRQRIGRLGRALGRFGVKSLQGRGHDRAQTLACHALRELLEVVDA